MPRSCIIAASTPSSWRPSGSTGSSARPGASDDLPPLVPILCGSFAPFTHGAADPLADRARMQAIAALRAATAGRRVLVVASADLAHVGPAFGDERGWDALARDSLKASDERLLAVAADWRSGGLPGHAAGRSGRAPRLWIATDLLGVARARWHKRAKRSATINVPADEAGASWVTIAGMAYT